MTDLEETVDLTADVAEREIDAYNDWLHAIDIACEDIEQQAEDWLCDADLIAFTQGDDYYWDLADAEDDADTAADCALRDNLDEVYCANESAVAEHTVQLHSWRRRAMQQLQRLVGNHDNRVLAIEAARLAGEQEFADRLLREVLP